MFDPLRRLKYLPWINLLQAALVTILIAIAIDLLLSLLLTAVPILVPPFNQLLNSPVGSLLILAIPVGLGALGVLVLERWFRQVILTSATLWAFVPCLALWVGLTALMPFSFVFMPSLDYVTVVTLLLGIFWKGKRYWR